MNEFSEDEVKTL